MESNRDSLSSGERTGISPNRVYLTVRMAYVQSGLWEYPVGVRAGRELQSKRLVKALWKGAP